MYCSGEWGCGLLNIGRVMVVVGSKGWTGQSGDGTSELMISKLEGTRNITRILEIIYLQVFLDWNCLPEMLLVSVKYKTNALL